MSLSGLQQAFGSHLTDLFEFIKSKGYGFTLGESYRSDEQACINALTEQERKEVESLLTEKFPDLAAAIGGSKSFGIKNSVHRFKLAQDLNLFHNDVYVEDPAIYKIFGDWWKLQHPAARYGGDWGDGDHFSFEYQGVK